MIREGPGEQGLWPEPVGLDPSGVLTEVWSLILHLQPPQIYTFWGAHRTTLWSLMWFRLTVRETEAEFIERFLSKV